jgi:hypothetical protein
LSYKTPAINYIAEKAECETQRKATLRETQAISPSAPEHKGIKITRYRGCFDANLFACMIFPM